MSTPQFITFKTCWELCTLFTRSYSPQTWVLQMQSSWSKASESTFWHAKRSKLGEVCGAYGKWTLNQLQTEKSFKTTSDQYVVVTTLGQWDGTQEDTDRRSEAHSFHHHLSLCAGQHDGRVTIDNSLDLAGACNVIIKCEKKSIDQILYHQDQSR